MPMTGGAIQLANLPGSTTRPIRLATKARSPPLGSQRSTLAFHSASLMTWPLGYTFTPLSAPMLRWKALCGTSRRNGMPAFSITLFQRSMPPWQSAM